MGKDLKFLFLLVAFAFSTMTAGFVISMAIAPSVKRDKSVDVVPNIPHNGGGRWHVQDGRAHKMGE